MADSKLEIRIIEDQEGTHIDLNNLTLEASKSIQIILDSFSKIIEEENNDNLVISIKEGSACVAINAPEHQLEIVHNKFQEVLNHRSTDGVYVDSLKAIQKRVQFIDLKYQISYVNPTSSVNLLEGFKQTRKFKKKRRSPLRDQNLKLTFIKGKMIEIGGKYPNIHIEQGFDSYTISCSEKQARRVQGYLYNENVMISAWTKKNIDGKFLYSFCDHYVNEELFNELNTFIEENLTLSGTRPLKDLHNKLVECLKNEDFGKVKKIIKLFKTDLTDINRLRTILRSTKYFKSEDELKEILIATVDLIESKINSKLI